MKKYESDPVTLRNSYKRLREAVVLNWREARTLRSAKEVNIQQKLFCFIYLPIIYKKPKHFILCNQAPAEK